MPKVSKAQVRRAIFFVLLLQLSSTSTICSIKRHLGINDKAYHTRLEQLLTDYHSIADAPRAGRPAKYSDDQLSQAKMWLMSLELPCHCARDLVDCLVEEGILPEGTPPRGFMPAFKAYLAQQGLQLKYGQRTLTFPLSQAHITGRLKRCLEMQHIFTSATVKDWWFEDEITIDQGGVPKGEP